MNREIKFKYVFKDGLGKFHMLTQNIEQVEVWNDIRINIIKGWKIVNRLQYIGLKDKDGKEIYEGDICKVIDPNGEEEIQYIVEWHPSSGYVYEPEEGYGEFDLTSVGFAMDMEYSFEIIGNIYENPELCK